jgi:streptogrisin C
MGADMRGIPSAICLLGVTTCLAIGASGAASAAPLVQTSEQAIAQDAAEYARLHGVSAEEAIFRLRAQEASVPETDRIRAEYRGRLAGISIEHQPEFRIVVLLTGSDPVPDRVIEAGGAQVPIQFRTGAGATHDQLVAALRTHQATISDAVPRARGMGIDGRSGKLVLLVRNDIAKPAQISEAEALLEGLAGVPSQIRLVDSDERNLAIEGGARVEGVDPRDGRRYACTTGFVVADGQRTGILTAAHCPDELEYLGPDGRRVPLAYVGAWGARYQDVQLHAATTPLSPYFLVDRVGGISRPLTGQRRRDSTRAGETVCRRGERTGYSCSTVDLTDFAPPGDLCAGLCEPVWVSVTGPTCGGGDSGGPVFAGTIAFGIVKGGSYDRAGRCSFYFYMSTDYLPEGWSLMFNTGPAVVAPVTTMVARPATPEPASIAQ